MAKLKPVTPGELLLKVMQCGTVSTNVYLRRLHNFCVDMNWLPWPLIPKRQWPTIRFKDKRAITWGSIARFWGARKTRSENHFTNSHGISALRNRIWLTCKLRT